MELKNRYQGHYKELIKEGNCQKLINQVKVDRTESSNSWVFVILALSTILEDKAMSDDINKGLLYPIIGTLIKDTINMNIIDL